MYVCLHILDICIEPAILLFYPNYQEGAQFNALITKDKRNGPGGGIII